MASEGYNVGDIVWAKMKSYPWWPSMISEPRKNVKKPEKKKPMYFVEFFGSATYAWIVEEFIQPYEKHKSEHLSCSLPSFKTAINELNNYLSRTPAKSKVPKPKDVTSKADSVSLKKKPLQINHSPVVKHIKSPVTQNALKAQKPESYIRANKKPPKRQISENPSSSSILNKVPATNSKYLEIMSNLSPYLESSSVSYPDDIARTHTATGAVLARAALAEKEKPEIEPILFDESDQTMIAVTNPSDLKVGFIGLGNMGGIICKKMVCAGYKVTVWNRSPEKTHPFENFVTVCKTPQDVVAASDITFCCVSSPTASKEIVFGNCGVLKEIGPGKGYVEITSIDPETSKDIAEAITKKQGQYLESPVLGSRSVAEAGQLIILAAGDNEFFELCKPCLKVIGERAFYLGEVGNAAKMNLILNMMMGTSLVCLVEAMSLANTVKLSLGDLLEIIELGPMRCPLFSEKAKDIINKNRTLNTPLVHIQRDLQLALQLGDKAHRSLPTTAAANELLKYAKGLGYNSHDITSLYILH